MTKEEKCHPKVTANFFSQVTLFGLLWNGYSRPLEQEDLYDLLDGDCAEQLTKHLQKKWEEEICRVGKSKRNPRLWRALLSFFTWKEYGFIVFTTLSSILSENVVWFSTMKLLGQLWTERSSGSGTTSISHQRLLIYLCLMIMGNLFKSLSNNHFYLKAAILGIRARAAVVGLLYKKVRTMQFWSSYQKTGNILVCIRHGSKVYIFKFITHDASFSWKGWVKRYIQSSLHLLRKSLISKSR